MATRWVDSTGLGGCLAVFLTVAPLAAQDKSAKSPPQTQPKAAAPAKPADKAPAAKADKPADKAPAKAPTKAPAPAVEPKPAGKKGIDEARRRMEAGQTEFSAGHYDKAAAEFEAAYDAMPYSAFLYNAAFAAEKAGDLQRAIAQYQNFLASDPSSPDAQKIKDTIDRLNKELSQPPAATPKAADSAKPAAQPDEKAMEEIRSLVLVESEPPGAPLDIFERVVPTAPAFKAGGDNAGWRQIVSGAKTPKDFSLKVGHYHAVIEAFQDYKRSETDINLSPGHVYTFKANLSQGEFLGYVRVKSNVEGAKIFLDDPPPHKTAPWARTPQGGPVNEGEHKLWVEAPGYRPFTVKVSAPHGQHVDVDAELRRVDYGYLVLDGNIDIPEVKVDGKKVAPFDKKTGAVKIKLPAGAHQVLFDASGVKKVKGEVDVPRGQERPVHATMNESYPRGKAIALGILGAAAIAGGFVLNERYGEYNAAQTLRSCSAPPSGPDDQTCITEANRPSGDLVTIFNVTRIAAFSLGGLFTALSIFYSVYDPLPDSLIKSDKPREFPDDEGQSAAAPEKKAPAAKSDKKKSGSFLPVPYFARDRGPAGVWGNQGGINFVGTF